MLKIVFLCSGAGGNLRFMSDAIRLGWIENATICGVITDRECLANQFARANNIWTKIIDFSEQDQCQLMAELTQLAPNVIVTNVHKILSAAVVGAFRGILVNLHYSLLPAFGGVIGTKPVRQALDYGALFVGTTVHLVDALVDTGRPLVQAVIPVEKGDDTESLMDVVFRCGCISLINGVQALRTDERKSTKESASSFKVCGRTVFINPVILYSPDFETENFWLQLKSGFPA